LPHEDVTGRGPIVIDKALESSGNLHARREEHGGSFIQSASSGLSAYYGYVTIKFDCIKTHDVEYASARHEASTGANRHTSEIDRWCSSSL
jgi:hypothetical protein